MTATIKMTFAFAIAVLASACAQEDAAPPSEVTKKNERPEFLWQEGSDRTQAYVAKDIALKCWPLGDRFDCLYASVSDGRDQIADAPVYWDYYRFAARQLPSRRTDIEPLQTADGYACSTTKRGNVLLVREEIWKDGNSVVKNLGREEAYQASVWTPQNVADLFKEHSITPARPYFACQIVNDLVQQSGLEIIDTAVVGYDAIMQADRFALPSPVANATEDVAF